MDHPVVVAIQTHKPINQAETQAQTPVAVAVADHTITLTIKVAKVDQESL